MPLDNLPEPIESESDVPSYSLPDPLVKIDGTRVKDPEEWFAIRRPEILSLFESHVYGKTPRQEFNMDSEVILDVNDIEEGLATMREVKLTFTRKGKSHSATLLLFIPNLSPKPVPAFVGLNFFGNHTIHPDSRIHLHQRWSRNRPESGITDNKATESSRGSLSHRWPLRKIMEHGTALATLYCGDFDTDWDDGFQNGVHPLFYDEGQSLPMPDEWGTIGAWAWGLSRALDYLESDPSVDNSRVASIGHSRLGKTSLWAGAQDPRFALVISNESGCGGAALSRRRFGERLSHINTYFPHWFCRNFRKYNERECELPVDQHMLISMVAPRPVYVGSAEKDLWCDPKGEYLSLCHADPVYRFLGTPGFSVSGMPGPDQSVGSQLGYHIRSGDHDLIEADWLHYLNFADRFLR